MNGRTHASGRESDEDEDAEANEPKMATLNLNLREHNIGFYLPPGAHLEGRLRCPTGALIAGTFIGELLVESGSLIITGSAGFRGIAEADRVYVEGRVASAKAAKGASRSILIGRRLIAASADSEIDADLFAPTFTTTRAKIWGRMHSLEEVVDRPLGKKATDGRPEGNGEGRRPTLPSDGSAARLSDRPTERPTERPSARSRGGSL